MKRNLLFLILLLPIYSFSQNLPNVIPPSPQTQELNKYIDFPVDFSTGVPEISIPLYVIKTKGLTIPITLNYHASGIKNGQEDGDVGVGWSLSSNYRVSRTIYGRPDSKDIGKPSNFETAIQTYTDDIIPAHPLLEFHELTSSEVSAALQTYFDRDKYLSKFANIHDPNMNMPPGGGPLLDGEFDHFKYSLPGQGGTFIINDRINKTVAEFNPTNNKFSYLDDVASNNITRGIIGFSIKDVNQNLYSFGEQLDKSGFNVLEAINDYYQKTVATAWALTDIDTKYGEKIKFTYNSKSVTTKYQMQASISVQNCGFTLRLDPAYIDLWKADANNEYPNSSYDVFALSNILTPFERVEFLEHTSTFFANKVHQINVYDLSDNALIKRIQFYYGKLDFYPSGYTFLDSVKVFGTGLVESQTYRFDYYNRNLGLNTVLVPDQWGYNKFETGIYHLLHNEFKTDPMGEVGTECENIYFQSTLNTEKPGFYSDRMYNPNPEIFSIKSVFYPTGGKTVYEYEPNKILYTVNQERHWGGIRIKAITHYDGDVAKLRRSYTYDINGSGIGSPSYYLDHTDFRKEYATFPGDYNSGGSNIGAARRSVNYTSYPQGDPVDLDSRGYYSYVTEYISMGNDNSLTNGKITYKYNLPHPVSSRVPFSVDIFNDDNYIMKYQGSPTFISEYRYWKKPLLTEKTFYSSTNALVKKETYTYNDKLYPSFKGFKVRPWARVQSTFNQFLPYYYLFIGSFYNYGVYNIETGLSLLQQKEETLYSESGAITTATTYGYNGLNQLVTETTTDSKSQVVEKHTEYSSDKSTWGGIFTSMVQANNLNEVLEQTVIKNNNVISQISSDYIELSGEIFVPSKVQQLNTYTQQLEDAILYNRYDSKGNVLSVSKANDVPISYIWSYKGTMPIAQIKGATYEDVENILGVVALVNFSTLAHPQKTDIDQFLSPLKAAIANGGLPNAELLSFSHDPLVGMKSQTDSRGRSTYYEYNGFGQLSLVRDHDGNILKKYEYNYVGQPENAPGGCTNTMSNWVNIGSPSCETANGANTGNQLQNQIDNNPCSNSYNKTRTAVLTGNAPPCSKPIYAKLSYEDYYSSPYDAGADIVVRFYSDAACQNPISVTDLQLNYNVAGFAEWDGNYSYNYSITANGTYVLLEGAAILRVYNPDASIYWSQDNFLIPGNYTIVL